MVKKQVQSKHEVRRSTREKKPPKDDQYWRGMPNQFAWLGVDISQDESFPKRRRKNKHDQNEDYQGGCKNSKKKAINFNKIKALLQWRYQTQQQELKIITDQQHNDPNAKVPSLFKEKISKNIITQKLEDLAQNIQALFINIDWGKKGQTIQDFQKLRIQSIKFMSKGIVFIWAPKQLVSQILQIMNKKNFFYVQNLQVINFNREKAIRQYCPNLRSNETIVLNKQKSQYTIHTDQISQSDIQLRDIVRNLQFVQPNQLIMQSKSPFFNSSKRTLLMFRKTSNQKVQLRHQRTCDVVFDMPMNPEGKPEPEIKRYIYNMIQTLLPEALLIQYKNKNQLSFKMVQLWGDKGTERIGWLNIIQA